MAKALLSLTLILPAIVGCGSPAAPGTTPTTSPPTSVGPTTNPSAQPTPTASTPATSPSTTTPATTTPSAGWTVVSSRVAYQWQWPGHPVTVTHAYRVPPVAQLITIGAGNHPNDPFDRPYNRMSFSFNTGYPSYTFEYTNQLIADGSGQRIPLEGLGVLRIVFNPAQAHNPAGTASTIQSQPPAHLGMTRMVAYAQAGDFEGYVSYGIGITWPNQLANPQIAVRVYEVTYVNGTGEYRYVIALDVDAR